MTTVASRSPATLPTAILLSALLLSACATSGVRPVAGVAPSATPATAEPVAAGPPGYTLPNTEVHRIPSSMGRDYELIVALPASYAANPDRRYPVLYVTDAHYAVPLIRSIVSYVRNGGRDVEDHILVGLGYAVGETRQFSRRRDYTPSPNGDVDAVSDMPGRAVAYGGAEPYRRHVRDEVFPFIDRCYRTDPARRIFAGHSYGGLFGSHVLLTEPEMFQRYIIMSPSLWYDRRLLLARERGYAMTNRDMKAEVLMLIGSEETSPTPDTEPFADAKHDMTGDQAKFVAALRSRNYPGLILEAAELPGEDHNSVYPMAVTRGLKWALKPAD